MAALEAELRVVKAQNRNLRKNVVSNDEVDEEEEEDEEEAPEAPAMPASFLMTPEKPTVEASWVEKGWTDWSQSPAPPAQPPGIGEGQGASAPPGAP